MQHESAVSSGPVTEAKHMQNLDGSDRSRDLPTLSAHPIPTAKGPELWLRLLSGLVDWSMECITFIWAWPWHYGVTLGASDGLQ